MFEIVEDEVGRHDFLLTPCSKDTFRIIYGDKDPHQGCFGNLAAALAPYGITEDAIPTTFNVFMYVSVDGVTGKIKVLPPPKSGGTKDSDRSQDGFGCRLDRMFGTAVK